MALVIDDRTKEITGTTGTGTWNLTAAVTGFQTFVAGVGDGNTCPYFAVNPSDKTEWETGIGTVTDAAPDTLARSVLTSSNGNALVNFTNAPVVGVGWPSDIATMRALLNYQLSQVGIPVVGSATYTTAEEAFTLFHSSGWITDGDVTLGSPTTTVTVAAGTGFVRATDDATAQLLSFNWPLTENIVLTDGSLNYIYARFSGGTPDVIATVTKSTDFHTNVLLATVFRDGSELHITQEQRHQVGDHANHMIRRIKATMPFARETGGVTTEVGTRNLAVSAGLWWEGLTPFITAALNTVTPDTFDAFYDDNAGGFTEQTGETQINKTQWDDGSGSLDTLSPNKFGVHWIYLGVDGHLYVVFGTTNDTLAVAEDAKAPSNVPAFFTPHVRLIAKVIIKVDTDVFADLTTAFETSLTGSTGIARVEDDPTPTLGSHLRHGGQYIEMGTGGDITSASPLVIDVDGDSFDVTGVTGFSAMTVAADRHFFTRFTGALTMTHGVSLSLPGADDIDTAAGDIAEWVSTAENTVRCVNYTKVDGTAVVTSGGADQVARNNIMLNAFRIAINGGLSVLNMEDGLVDEFEDETGVDTGTSTNETYDATDNFYNNVFVAASFSTTLTTNDIGNIDRALRMVIDAPALSASGDNCNLTFEAGSIEGFEIDLCYIGEKAASGDAWDMKTSPAPVKVTFSSSDGFSIGAGTTIESDLISFPIDSAKSYVIAFDVGSNGGADDARRLTSLSNVSTYFKTSANEAAIADVTGYSLLNDVISINKLEVISTQDMTLQSNAFTTNDADPTEARIVLFEEDVDSVTLNTDLKAYASRDGGTTFTQITLADEGDYETGKAIFTGSVSISGQPAGASMKWKLTTHNAKELKVHGIALQWS